MTQGTKIALGVVLLLAILGGLYAYNVSAPERSEETATTTPSTGSPNPAGTVESGQSTGEQCAAIGGTWSEQHKECMGISKNSCQEIGGTFNECASACRHDPAAQACIMMCVQVCTIN